jgi:hypothetical protein
MNWVLIEEISQALFAAAIQAAQAIAKQTGKTPQAAVAEVVDHLTPGAPLSPTLSAEAAPHTSTK